ncbi:Homeobox Protein Goosecoid-2 [Manis pentadactyla]|nr:Homeobox Protein Goosecoid-2 [Manis pentadactyla]
MQEPGSFGGSALSSRPPRQRQERTVYSKEQQQELEKRFQMNQYPTYVEREALAARLNLREQQVQGAQENVPSVPAPVPALGTAWGFPAPGAQDEVPAAPAQAPVPAWVHDPYASAFSPDPAREADFSPLFSLPDSFKGPPSSVVSRYPEGDDCEDEDSYPKTLLDL